MGVQMKMQFVSISRPRRCGVTFEQKATEQLINHNRNNAIGYANIIYLETKNGGFVVKNQK